MLPRRDTALIASLRHEIGRVELRPHGVLPFGNPAIDGHLPGGGLARGALHAVTGEPGASLGFAAGLAGRLQRQLAQPVVWVSSRPELYGPGLARLGLDADRLLLVRAARPADLLWAFEEALRTPGIAAAIAETHALDAVAGRRLQLAAQAGGALGVLLLHKEIGSMPGAVTRWHVSAAPSMSDLPGLGCTRWHADLRRCRGAEPASWLMEWQDATDSAAGGFAVIGAPLDRPHRPAIRIAG
jgi:protein ImuA